jgi:hypothetical protein
MKYILIFALLGIALFSLSLLFVISSEAKPPRYYYRPATDTIVCVDGTTTNPCNMSSLYLWDVMRGWGQVTKVSNFSYRVNALFQIGNSTSANTTYFKSINEAILIENKFSTTTYTTTQFGEWNRNGGPHSSNGSYVRFNQTITTNHYQYPIYGTFYSYGSIFECRPSNHYPKSVMLDFVSGTTCFLNESIFRFFTRIAFHNTNSMVYDSQTTTTPDGWSPYVAPTHIWNKVKSEYQIYSNANAPVTIWNADIYGTYLWQRFGITGYTYGTLSIINPVHIEPGAFGYLIYIDTPTTDAHFVRFNYTLDLKVTNNSGVALSGVTVRIWNRSGFKLWELTTNNKGKIPNYTMLPYLHCYHPNTNGVPQRNISFTPYNMTISKSGYQTFKTTFNYSNPLNWTIALQNLSGLVVADNSVGCGGTIDFSYHPNTGSNGEWWVWVNLTGVGGAVKGFGEILGDSIVYLPVGLLLGIVVCDTLFKKKKEKR